MRAFQNFVNGKHTDAADGRTTAVVNPSTGEGFAEAPLSGASKCAVGDDVRSRREIGVRQDHNRIFRAALALRPFSGSRCPRVHLPCDSAGSCRS